MKKSDIEIAAKGLGYVLRPVLKKAADDLEDLLALVEDLQDRLGKAEAKIATLEARS